LWLAGVEAFFVQGFVPSAASVEEVEIPYECCFIFFGSYCGFLEPLFGFSCFG
jgi:hypothetical protein